MLSDILDDTGPIFTTAVALLPALTTLLIVLNPVHLHGQPASLMAHQLRSMRYFDSLVNHRSGLFIFLQHQFKRGAVLGGPHKIRRGDYLLILATGENESFLVAGFAGLTEFGYVVELGSFY